MLKWNFCLWFHYVTCIYFSSGKWPWGNSLRNLGILNTRGTVFIDKFICVDIISLVYIDYYHQQSWLFMVRMQHDRCSTPNNCLTSIKIGSSNAIMCGKRKSFSLTHFTTITVKKRKNTSLSEKCDLFNSILEFSKNNNFGHWDVLHGFATIVIFQTKEN